MRLRTTLLLLALVIGMSSFIWYYERHQQSTLERRQAGSLTSLEVPRIETIELRNASGTAKFKRKTANGDWFFTDPFDDRVDPDFMQRILDLASKAEIADTLAAKDVSDSNRKSYGLDDQEAMLITWRSGGKTIGKLKVGKVGALGDTVYAEAPDHKTFRDVYLIWARPDVKSSNLRDELARPLADLRDQKLLPFNSQKVVSFSIRRPGTAGEIQVQRKLISEQEATPWAITKPLKSRGDQKEIDNWVGILSSARASKLLAPGAEPKDLPAAPAVELQFQDDLTSKGSIVRLYPPETPEAESIIGFLADRKAWFTIETSFLTTVPDTPEKLRSNKLADLDVKNLTTILIQTQDQEPLSLYRIGNRWVNQKPDKTYVKASGDRVSKTVQALNGAEIGKFVTDSLTKPEEYGLDHPWQSITFASAQHTSEGLKPITPENSLVLQFGVGPTDKRLYANYKGESSVFLMMPEHFNLVPSQALKWKDLQILSFGRPSVRRFQQTVGAEPPTTLVSPPQSFKFKALRSDNDVTNLLVNERIERMLVRLGSLNVSDWLSGLQEGRDALLEPKLELELDIEYAEDKADFGAAKTKTIKLSFAPAGKADRALYYIGSCTDVADYFLITREVFQELATPMLEKKD